MYEAFFGLTEKPFALTPNPRFVFQSEQYRTGEQALLYGIAQKEGFMLVTGAPGTGKTTLCRDLLEKLDPARNRVALLFNPFLNGVEMLQALLSEFGIGDGGVSSRKELLDRLNGFLLEQLAAGRTCIAIFDEAQHLSTEFLEQIRVLSNLETHQEKLIQIILVGQPELLALVRTPQMAQLDQRVSVRCTLAHLSEDETNRYIYHRLNVAGAQGRIRFQDEAIRLLHNVTGGVPRLINLTADRALLAAYAAQQPAVSLVHMRQAVAALRGEEGMRASATPPQRTPRPAPSATLRAPNRWRWRLAAAALAVVALGSATWWRVDGTAELLAVRAAAADGSASEAAFRRIVRDHPRSRQRERALLRLAQLEIARGEARGALNWLNVLYQDYPNANGGAEQREYWTARALLASGDTARACAVSAALAKGDAALDGIGEQCDAFALRQRAVADSLAAAAATFADTVALAARPPEAARADSLP